MPVRSLQLAASRKQHGELGWGHDRSGGVRIRGGRRVLQDSQPGEIDLHGLYVKEAIRYTDQSIQEARARGDTKIKFIVGASLYSCMEAPY